MKKLVCSILIIMAGLFVVDRIGGEVMWWVNQHTQENAGLKIRTMVNEVNADILFLGTSRCNRHYVPSIISDSTGMSAYNGGIDASDNIYAHYTLLNLILPRYIPKVICLEIAENDFTDPREPFSTVSFFAPYFGRNEQSDSIFRLAKLYWHYKLFHLYRFNAKATSNIAGLIATPANVGKDGYVPSPQPTHPINSIPAQAEIPTGVNYQKIEFLQRFISKCKQNNIKLILTISPSFSVVRDSHYKILKDIAEKNSIPFLDYHTQGIFLNHSEYFEDKVHLWDKGARLYSSMFAHDLNQILQDNL